MSVLQVKHPLLLNITFPCMLEGGKIVRRARKSILTGSDYQKHLYLDLQPPLGLTWKA